ncbi:MAG: porphobilinogen synthase [Armatimonadetes bacterium]|nr:porphobilinogen synthase [Armatimonadota bacterium]NIM23427.1 porphobilinogen synthase [Armatimonadota bacterium]NIM67292.1 porphobilinogen synthase [Armatimonadota bacterium]NIM75790.1 porphobilinogen synthase [Armatimonadota bacterium]NIN05478.1 porphobilinogen synthase [Armatimonadota bacterium]
MEPEQKKETFRLVQRPRRLRRTPALRELVKETRIHPGQFIYPLFVVAGIDRRKEIEALPGQYHLSPDRLVEEAEQAWQEGIRAVLLFGVPERKDESGLEAANPEGPAQQGVRALKSALPELVVMTDVCLCGYTTHGHCGVVGEGGEILNDPTLEILTKIALSHAEAGADLVGPSDMMDGRVAAIRCALDEAGFYDTGIMAYSAKYASAFYGPFREAVDSAPQFGDRRSYQMAAEDRREALREARQDAEEGADIIMVKPALAYLDVISDVRAALDRPVAAYNVSGEYAMVKAAAARGWVDERATTLEVLTSIARAGADLIITYHAREAARWLKE